MTSTSATGIQRPPIRTVNSGRAPGHYSASQITQQPPRSIPRQLSIDRIPELLSSGDSSKPTIKRQKVESIQDTVRNIDLTIPESIPGSSGQFIKQTSLSDAKPTDAIKGPESITVKTGVRERPRPPFPQALGRVNDGIGRKAGGSLKAIVKEEVQARPYSLEIPKSAPQYGDNAPADFFPWTGNHPEDILNENSTRNGYYDRVHISQNESNGARPSVWSNLKTRSGVQILSSLFASALDQRHQHGTVKASCTFKPPPRVTLTDTKREAWLRDLANPTIPLRRLSRTIPHGIKGKTLLDHCMTKNIPTWRAVWLAKCVGANELRAFKRKGNNGAFTAGGEAKWIKDWTTNVEQFIEALLDSCGTHEWKTEITYGLQLIAHIYSEHLLDEDHFLDWMLASFQSSEVDRLPIWLLITRIFWKDLWRYRHRGRQLAEAMLNHLQLVNQKDMLSAYKPIQLQLAAMLRSCVKCFPDCFILPACWIKHEATLNSCSDNLDQQFVHALKGLSTRNEKFKRALDEDDLATAGTPRCKLIKVLDNIPLRFNLPAVSDSCLAVVNEYNLLIATVVEWASTRYRNRIDRVYIAVRLLRRWRKQGVSLDNPISIFLGQCSTLAGVLRANVSKIVAELVRSSNFSISKYLQWLISRGPSNSTTKEHDKDDYPSTLLMELPLHGLPQHVLSLRQILLNNVGHPAVEEQETIQAVKMVLAEKLPDLLAESNSDRISRGAVELSRTLRGTVKSEISYWIRQSLVIRLRQEEDSLLHGQINNSMGKTLTVNELKTICTTLEDYGDFAVLADILSLASNSNDSSLLTIVVTVVNRHLDVFWAIGAAQEMFHDLLTQSVNCLNRDSPDKQLLLSLVDLGEQLPNAARQVRQLRKQIILCDSKPSLSACSPVSDHVAEALLSAEANFVEEMETLLSSGNSMDRQTLSRIFATITKRLEKSWNNDNQAISGHYALLDRLYAFDKEAFIQLLLNWLGSVQGASERPKMQEVLAPLVCAGTLKLHTYFERVVLQLGTIKDAGSRARFAVETLSLLVEKLEDVNEVNTDPHTSLGEDCFSPPSRDYRYYNAQRQVIYDYPDLIQNLLLEVISPNAHSEAHGTCRTCDLVLRSAFPQIIQTLVVQHPSIGHEIEQQLGLQSEHYPITRLVNLILGLMDTTNASKSISKEFHQLLDIVDDFNTIFCQLKLLTLLGGPQTSQKDIESVTDRIISMLIQKLTTPTKSESTPWVCLVRKLSHNRALKFHEQITSILLASIPHVEVEFEDTQKSNTIQKDTLKSLLHSIDVVERQIPKSASSSIFNRVDDKLRSLHSLPLFQEANLARNSPPKGVFSIMSIKNEFDVVYTNVDIILRFVVIHLNMSRHPSLSPAILARLLVGLGLLLVHPLFSSHPITSTYIFDTIGLLSDCLSLETRHLCVRTLRDQHQIRDPRLQFLIGYSENIDGERLRLVMKGSHTLSDSTGASPASSSSNVQTATSMPFAIRRWEMVQDATPIIGENDTSLSLSLFGARKAIL